MERQPFKILTWGAHYWINSVGDPQPEVCYTNNTSNTKNRLYHKMYMGRL
jgi:hypothetical protein